MPCRDDFADAEHDREVAAETHLVKAALCAILSKLGKIPDGIDWKAAGVKKGDVTTWWAKHIAADQMRRDLERRQAEAQRIHDEAEYDRLRRKLGKK